MLSLYVHIPFCQSKCLYCSFVVTVGQEKKAELYLEALAREAEAYQGATVTSVYIGGGTPSILSVENIQLLFSNVVRKFEISSDAEITFEANPESVTDEKLDMLRMCGVNRLSLGAQTFHEHHLRKLGRNHDAAAILDSWRRIVRAGFANTSMDLMFALPAQTSGQLREDLEQMLRLEPRHISLYCLDVEPRSHFYARRQMVPSPQKQARFYEVICDQLAGAGYHQYEVSNFARDGNESRHNLNYWRCGEYVGLGLGAHSYLAGRRFWNTGKLSEYFQRTSLGQSPKDGEELLSRAQQAKERLLFGLRMNDGVSFPDLRNDFPEIFNLAYLEKLEAYEQSGHLVQDGEFLRTTSKGRLVLDEISARLI